MTSNAMYPPRATKIVATLGPASSEPQLLEQMIRAGVNCVRLNFSHGLAQDHIGRAELVRAAAQRARREVTIMANLQGPKIRVGKFVKGKLMLEPARSSCSDKPAPDPHPRLALPQRLATPRNMALYRNVRPLPQGQSAELDEALREADRTIIRERSCTAVNRSPGHQVDSIRVRSTPYALHRAACWAGYTAPSRVPCARSQLSLRTAFGVHGRPSLVQIDSCPACGGKDWACLPVHSHCTGKQSCGPSERETGSKGNRVPANAWSGQGRWSKQ
jgi:hypothetical protein